jgi:hypothetical protein
MITDILTIAADIVTIKEYTRQLLHGETSRTENRTDHDRSSRTIANPSLKVD